MGVKMITKLSCLALLLISMTASAGGFLDDSLVGKWSMKQYKNNELIQDTILEVHSDKTFRVTVNIYGQLYGWYSGVWVLNTDVVTWTRTASGPYPAESDPIDMDRIESVDKQKLVLQSAKYKNADPQILERVE